MISTRSVRVEQVPRTNHYPNRRLKNPCGAATGILRPISAPQEPSNRTNPACPVGSARAWRGAGFEWGARSSWKEVGDVRESRRSVTRRGDVGRSSSPSIGVSSTGRASMGRRELADAAHAANGAPRNCRRGSGGLLVTRRTTHAKSLAGSKRRLVRYTNSFK